MKGDPEFIILKYQAWLDAAEFEDVMLGAIIREPLSPSTNYIPDKPPKDIVRDVQTGTATDFILAESGSKAAEAALSAGKVGGFTVKGSREESVRLAGKLIRYKRIRQLDRYWSQLKQDEEVAAVVPTWMSLFNTWPVCLVVGLMICEDVELSIDGASSREIGGHVQVPIGQVTLGTGAELGQTDPRAALGAESRTASIFKATMGKSNIFAVELRKVTTEVFRRKQLRLESGGPNVDPTRLAGYESEGDYYDHPEPDEELLLDELSEQELAGLEV